MPTDRPKPMLVDELREKLAELEFLDKKQAGQVLTHLERVVSDTLVSGRDVNVAGFLKFEARIRAARTGRNPHTGQPVQILEKRIAKVRPLKRFADWVAAG